MTQFKLDNHPKIAPGFTTPDGFFDAFPQKVLPRLVPEKPVRNLFERSRYAIYAVAAILIVALSIPLLTPQTNIVELDDSTIENYLAQQANFGQFELLTLIDEDDIAQLHSEYVIDEQLIEETLIQGQNLEQYLTE